MAGENEGPSPRTGTGAGSIAASMTPQQLAEWERIAQANGTSIWKTVTQADVDRFGEEGAGGPVGSRLLTPPVIRQGNNQYVITADGSLTPYDPQVGARGGARATMFGGIGMGMAALPVAAAVLGAGAAGAAGGTAAGPGAAAVGAADAAAGAGTAGNVIGGGTGAADLIGGAAGDILSSGLPDLTGLGMDPLTLGETAMPWNPTVVGGPGGDLIAAGMDPLTLGETTMPWSTNPSLTALDPTTSVNSNIFSNLGSTPPGTSSAIERILKGTGTASDYISILGKGGATALGIGGTNATTDALNDVNTQFMQLGAGDRARLEASYAPGFNIWDQAGYKELLPSINNSMSSALSIKGNPAEDPNSLATMSGNLANVGVNALQNYRGQLIQGGGLGLSPAATASLTAAGMQGMPYNTLAAGIGSITAPDDDLDELLKRYSQGKITLGSGYTSQGR